jgi:hypothetical protein
MSTSDSDTTSSSSVTAIESSSRQFLPPRNQAQPNHASYPRRQSSLSDARPPVPPESGSSSRPLTSGRGGWTQLTSSPTREALVAIDRKRRLTSSAQDHGRRRQGPGALGEHAHDDDLGPVAEIPSSHHSQQHEIVDLTGSSPPTQRTPHRHRQQSRTSSSSSRRYVVPPWQPDSEVPECPICGRTFTWLFRRHHCRKCGRVVCNDCSPHRITIPRQFIVNPPSPDATSSPTRNDGIRVETIDLTGEDDIDGRPMSRYLGGGEKVRLCNPCVPDPQPEPPPNFPPSSENLESPPSFDRGPAPLRPGPPIDMLSRSFRQANRHRPGGLSAIGPPSSFTGAHSHSFASLGGNPRRSSFASSSSMLPAGYDPRFGSQNVRSSLLITLMSR